MRDPGQMSWLLDLVYLDIGICAVPFWLWKVPQARRYRAGLFQRLGFAPIMHKHAPRLWVHVASVGEASLPQNLIRAFRKKYPRWDIVFSTFTDTGMERARKLYRGCPVFFWPLDFSFSVERSLDRVKPDAVVLIELEIWPNFLSACRQRGLPVALINGRISRRSSRFLRGLNNLMRTLWDPVRVCCARSSEDARGFLEAGVPPERVFSCGSLKYDAISVDGIEEKEQHLRDLLHVDAERPILVAGSTHPGEEEIVCRVYKRLRTSHKGLRLILAPRHIERADGLERQMKLFGLSVARKTALDRGEADAGGSEAILIDTVGDLAACYSLATCAFIGRSLVAPGGGQNMMEPAALGKPVVIGPHTGNFKPEMALLRGQDAIVVVEDETDLLHQLDRLLSDPQEAERLGRNARLSMQESRGATARSLQKLEEMLARENLL